MARSGAENVGLAATPKMPYDRPAVFWRRNWEKRGLCSRQAKCAKNRVLKAERPNPDLDIYFFGPLYPF